MGTALRNPKFSPIPKQALFVVNDFVFVYGGRLLGVHLTQPRGIQLLLAGDGFLASRCTSIQQPQDGATALRFRQGRGMRAEQLDMEAADDGFVFSTIAGGPGVTDSLITDSVIAATGATVAFICAGDSIQPDPETGILRNNLAGNVRGRLLTRTGPRRNGRYGYKFVTGNSDTPMENCWVENFVCDRAGSTRDEDSAQVRAEAGGL